MAGLEGVNACNETMVAGLEGDKLSCCKMLVHMPHTLNSLGQNHGASVISNARARVQV